MLVIKATKDSLKDLNVHPQVVKAPDPFFSWHVNYFTLYGKKHYVFMNDLSRLSLTVPGIRSNQSNKLREIFTNHLIHYLAVEDLPSIQVDNYLNNCNEMVITKTDSRSVISTLNEIMLIMKSLERDKVDYRDLDKRHKWNNRMIYKPIDYNYPIDVFVNKLKERFTNQ